MLSKYLPCGTGRYVFLWCVSLWCLMVSMQVLFVTEPLSPNRICTQPHGTTIPDTRPVYPLPIRMLAHLGLILCCASPQHVDGHTHLRQQQGGPSQTHATTSYTQHQQGQSQTQASSSYTHPAAPSTSATSAALNSHTTAPGAASVEPRPPPLRARVILFLCCVSPPHADGH
jgi:hypothetical protein